MNSVAIQTGILDAVNFWGPFGSKLARHSADFL